MACIRLARPRPIAPPTKDRAIASARKANKMACLAKPKARSVPISATRVATADCMVMVAPITAPIEKITVNVSPRILIKRDSVSDCSA